MLFSGQSVDYRWAQPFLATLSNWFWAASPDVGDSYGAWLVNFSIGNVDYSYRGYGYHVRLVRASQ